MTRQSANDRLNDQTNRPGTAEVAPSPTRRLSIGQCATLACLLEVSAPKPGNVHRAADCENLTFDDFVISAVAIGPFMNQAASQSVGQTVLQSIRVTQQLVSTNTNLGIVLLLSPLAAVPLNQPLAGGLPTVLSRLSAADSAEVYTAIRLAQPGGLDRIDRLDVADNAPANLLDAMQHAASWDLVARQYVTGFETVFSSVAPWLLAGQAAGWSLADSIVHAHVRLLAQEPDSLIARKCGRETADHASRWASQILEMGRPGDETYQMGLADLDFWLRSDGHRRNPGTTADLIAAGLFMLLRDDLLELPTSVGTPNRPEHRVQ